MKRYDEFVRVKTSRHGCETSIKGWTTEEYNSFFETLNDGDRVYVQCRDCGNIHEVSVDCQVCDLKTKIRKDIKI